MSFYTLFLKNVILHLSINQIQLYNDNYKMTICIDYKNI